MSDNLNKKKECKTSWLRIMKEYWRFAVRYRWMFVLSIFTYSISTFLDGVLAPFLYKNIVDGISGYLDSHNSALLSIDSVLGSQIMMSVWAIIIIYLVCRILYSVGDYTMSYFQSKTLRDLTDYSFGTIINHSYQFFINSFTGSLVKRAGRFVNSFEDIHDTLTYQIWLPLVKLVSVFAVLFFVSPIIGWMFFIWTIIFICLSAYFAKRRIILDLKEASADSVTTGRIADVFTNVLNLKMFSSSYREKKAFSKISGAQMVARNDSWNYQNFTYIVQGIVISWLQIMSLYVSVMLWFYGYISLGVIVLVYSYSNTVFDSVWGLGKQMSRISKAFSNASEMMEIIDTPIEILDKKRTEKSSIGRGEVVFDDVSFEYKQGNPIFTNFNLKISAGEKVGVVGTSGAGKTTITKLLLRFADVTEGRILIDGQDIRNITQDDLRASIAYVPQDPILFHRSLAENISYGKPGASMDEIIEASKLAHAHEFISNLNHGYDTLVGERGVKLSGGERQRVAIARAILKDAPILIMDEATSSLDSVSESHIKSAMDDLMKGRTTIVIAHRLSTIEKMDRIIVMEKGEIVEEGNHKDLMDKKGTYHNFWNHQHRGFIS